MTKQRRRKRTTDPASGADLLAAPILWLAGLIDRLLTRLARRHKSGK